MSTIEDIEYDTAKLAAMTNEELLLQLIGRADLKRPKREAQLQAKALFHGIVAETEATIAKLREDPAMDYFASAMERSLNEYIALVEVINGT